MMFSMHLVVVAQGAQNKSFYKETGKIPFILNLII